MTPRLLTRDEFLDTFAPPMTKVTWDESVDIWDYVDAIPLEPLDIVALGDVEIAYRDATGRYEHALVWTDRNNRFLAVVVDIASRSIVGHHMLDLDAETGTN